MRDSIEKIKDLALRGQVEIVLETHAEATKQRLKFSCSRLLKSYVPYQRGIDTEDYKLNKNCFPEYVNGLVFRFTLTWFSTD